MITALILVQYPDPDLEGGWIDLQLPRTFARSALEAHAGLLKSFCEEERVIVIDADGEEWSFWRETVAAFLTCEVRAFASLVTAAGRDHPSG